MNNKSFIQELALRSRFSNGDVQKMVNSVIDAMNERFTTGDAVAIPNFGTFEVKKRMERVITNPSTHQRMLVPPKLVLSFRPTPSVKEQLKSGGQDNG